MRGAEAAAARLRALKPLVTLRYNLRLTPMP
ncbi:hypothetical protein VARIO8X_120532 [Burkholderiales bacterium 8X]|nr:hypothetical protein VARIO8X_120532 [Burkholderiales bacterium 8X]